MIAQVLVRELATSQFWNDVLIGAALLVAGASNYYRRSNAEFGSIGVAAWMGEERRRDLSRSDVRVDRCRFR